LVRVSWGKGGVSGSSTEGRGQFAGRSLAAARVASSAVCSHPPMDPADRDALQRHYTNLPLLWLAKFARNTVYWNDRQMSLIVLLVRQASEQASKRATS